MQNYTTDGAKIASYLVPKAKKYLFVVLGDIYIWTIEGFSFKSILFSSQRVCRVTFLHPNSPEHQIHHARGGFE